jgi:hypothetical protein
MPTFAPYPRLSTLRQCFERQIPGQMSTLQFNLGFSAQREAFAVLFIPCSGLFVLRKNKELQTWKLC